MRAAACFNADDPVGGQHGITGKDFCVLNGVNVVGDGSHRNLAAHCPGNALNELGFPGANWPADANDDWIRMLFAHVVMNLFLNS